jgi:hypothetical protein
VIPRAVAARALLAGSVAAWTACAAAAPPVTPPPSPAAPEAAPPRAGLPPSTGSPREVTWIITSTPPGAAIWFDGADTGARTPATFGQPAPGRHSVRLVLDGYADDVSDLHQVADVGLSLGRGLRPKAEVEHEEETRVASKRPVDEAARAATRAFLGKDLARASVTYERSPSISALPFTVHIKGGGAGELEWMSLKGGSGVRRVAFRVDAADVRGILDALVAQGFSEVVGAERPGVPDEVRLRVTIQNAKGAHISAEKWASDDHARFDAVLDAIVVVMHKLPAEARREIGY